MELGAALAAEVGAAAGADSVEELAVIALACTGTAALVVALAVDAEAAAAEVAGRGCAVAELMSEGASEATGRAQRCRERRTRRAGEGEGAEGGVRLQNENWRSCDAEAESDEHGDRGESSVQRQSHGWQVKHGCTHQGSAEDRECRCLRAIGPFHRACSVTTASRPFARGERAIRVPTVRAVVAHQVAWSTRVAWSPACLPRTAPACCAMLLPELRGRHALCVQTAAPRVANGPPHPLAHTRARTRTRALSRVRLPRCVAKAQCVEQRHSRDRGSLIGALDWIEQCH